MTPNIDSQSLSMEHGSRKEEQETADVTAVTDSTVSVHFPTILSTLSVRGESSS